MIKSALITGIVGFSILLNACNRTPAPNDKTPTLEKRRAILAEKRANYIAPPQQIDVCQAIRETPKSEMQTFWLGLKPRNAEQNFDYRFSIPQAYFNQIEGLDLVDETGQSDGAVLFHARYPDFAPYNQKLSDDYRDYGDWDRSKPNKEYIGEDISILWGGWTFGDGDVARWLKSDKIRFYFKRKDSSPEGWQIEERPSSITPDLLELDPDSKYDRGTAYKKYRMFIHRDSPDIVTDQIFCHKENFGFGNCSHRFIYGQLAIKLRYESAYLKDWEQIKNKTKEFFDCATLDKRPRIKTED